MNNAKEVSLSEKEKQKLINAVRDDVKREVIPLIKKDIRNGVLRWGIKWFWIIVGIVGAIAWVAGVQLSLPGIYKKAEVYITNSITGKFAEPNIKNTLQEVASQKAKSIILEEVRPEIAKIKLEVEEISKIRERIEEQGATVDLVAKHAIEARELSEELAKKQKTVDEKLARMDVALKQAEIKLEEISEKLVKLDKKEKVADEKLEDMEVAVKEAREILTEIQLMSEFANTVISAQNDDRKAFDKLKSWIHDKENPNSSRAWEAVRTIIEEHDPVIVSSGYWLPWRDGLDPSTLSLQELRQIYKNTPAPLKPAIIEYIWGRQDINKKDRMEFLVEVVQNDSSLKAVEYAGRYFVQAAGLQFRPLAVEDIVTWWNNNKDSIQDNGSIS